MNELEKENISYFYIIEVDRDGERKYISKDFPKLFMYSKKILKAKRFYSEESALEFINNFNNGRYNISNPIIKQVKRVFNIV